MFYHLLLLCSALLLQQTQRSCLAAPELHLLRKRGPITCQPIGMIQRLTYRDCVGALNLIGQEARDLHQLLSFGIGHDVDVSINGDPLMWEFGTCAIELQAQGNVPQLSSWQNIRIRALHIAHRCAMRHRQGYSYFDRIAADSSPVAVGEGPNLQLWVGPKDVPEEMDEEIDEDLRADLRVQGSCFVAQRADSHKNSGSGRLWSSATTQNSGIGVGRKLLNSTTVACGNHNTTAAVKITGGGGP